MIQFNIGDRVRLIESNILDGLKGTIRTTLNDYSVEFQCKDNGQTFVFDDNDIDSLIIRYISGKYLERWEE